MSHMTKAARGEKGVAAALAVVLALTLAASPAFAQKRRGAAVVVVAKDGVRAGGELIAVKRDSLLIMDESGRDRSFNLNGIETVSVRRGSKAGVGVLFGAVLGLAAGAGLSSAIYHNADPCESIGPRACVIMLGTVAGGIGGAIAGAAAGKDLTIKIPDAINAPGRTMTLARLRKYARVGTAG